MNDVAYKEIVRMRYNDPDRVYSCDVSEEWLQRLSKSGDYKWRGFVALVKSMIESTGSRVVENVMLGDMLYDLEIPDLKTVIKIDPTASNVAYRDRQRIRAHSLDGVDASDNARNFDYRCVHIYDWDDIFKLTMLLQPRTKLNARDCTICELSKEEAHSFLKMYHLQDSANSYRYNYGLTYNGELVMVMVFGKPHFATSYQWQLRRFCSDPRYQIRGGASKLFKHFVDAVHPVSIISYCDRAKFNGAVYAKLGMTVKEKMQPTIMWSRGTEVKSDYAIHRMGYQYTDDSKSLSDRLLDEGWLPIYNCGQIVYEWHSPNPPCICSTEATPKRKYTKNTTRYSICVGDTVVDSRSDKDEAIKAARHIANSNKQITRVVRKVDGALIDEIKPRGGIQ